MKALAKCIVIILLAVHCVEALQRILGGTSKAKISFEDLEGQKEIIEAYAYVGSSIGVLILVGLVANLCYLLGAKNDAQKKIFAEMSVKTSPMNSPMNSPRNSAPPPGSPGQRHSADGDTSVRRGADSTFEETKRQSDVDTVNPSSPAHGGRGDVELRKQASGNSPKRKLVLTSSGQLRKHASSSKVDVDPTLPSTEQLPPVAPPPNAADRPRRKLKMKVGESGILQFHAGGE